MIASNGQNYSQICELLREMAVRSYKLSEYVMTNKLGYVPYLVIMMVMLIFNQEA